MLQVVKESLKGTENTSNLNSGLLYEIFASMYFIQRKDPLP